MHFHHHQYEEGKDILRNSDEAVFRLFCPPRDRPSHCHGYSIPSIRQENYIPAR